MSVFVLQSGPLFALAAAVLWGGGDFSGGMGAKSVGGTMRGALRVVLLSHTLSFIALVTIAAVRGDIFPHGVPLVWGIGAGISGGLSLTAFYVALSRGAMGTSAAISGLLAAAIPAAVSISLQGSPGILHLAGFVIAGIAIWLIAAGPNPESLPVSTSTSLLAVSAGIGFGIYFVALKYAGSAGLVWPMATARIGSLSTCLLCLLFTLFSKHSDKSSVKFSRKVVLWVVSTAVLDTSGNLFFMAATQAGRLDIAAVLASLYPASTILLAAWMLNERPTRRQGLGMAIAIAAVAMITL